MMVNTFGSWLRIERESLGLSRRLFGLQFDVTGQWIKFLESDEYVPNREFVARLATTLDADEDILLAQCGYMPHDLVDLLKQKPQLIRAILQNFGLKRDRPMPNWGRVKKLATSMSRPHLSQEEPI